MGIFYPLFCVQAQDNSPLNSKDKHHVFELKKSNTTPAKLATAPNKYEKKDLSIASWGGAYTKAQDIAHFKPFSKDTGSKLSVSTHSGSFVELKSKLSDGNWDLVDMTYHMVDEACKAGLIEPIDHDELAVAPDGTPVQEDFLNKSLHKCGVASMAWSSVIVYNKKAFKRKMPQTAQDFFNTKRFKGKRALPRTADYVLELALLADGVPPGEVYSTLETEDGIKRAFAKLNKIKRHIVWWTKPSEPFRLMSQKKVVMGIAYSGRAFSQIARDRKPFGIIWNGQIYDFNFWVIPKASANKKASFQFIHYATQTQRLAEQSKWFPYGPVRSSSVQLVNTHPEADINLKPFLPTLPSHLKYALRRDAVWWSTHRDILQSRFEKWIKGEKENTEEAVDARTLKGGISFYASTCQRLM